ncbi:MAG: outer membrane lipoprotein chaperone LolA, partial [Pseudomonadales bacterium]
MTLVMLWSLVFTTAALAGGDSQIIIDQAASASHEQALNDRLSGITSLHTRFEQSATGRNNEITRQDSGELWVEKPDRFRIVTGEPNAQTLVSDGDLFWSYDAELEQVIVSQLDKSIRDVPILLLGGNPAAITRNYRVSFYESERGDHFVLEPKTTTGLFASLTIVFTEELPIAISIRDNFGQYVLMEFIDPAVNVDLEPGIFTFNPPD